MEKYQLHDAILAEVNDLIVNGKKRITVLLPKGCEELLLMEKVVKMMHLTTVAIVSRKSIQSSLIEKKEELFGTQSVTIISAGDIVSDYPNTLDSDQITSNLLYVLFDTTPKDRVSLAKIIPPEVTVISFGSDTRVKGESFRNDLFYPFECTVFYSESLLDIRDLIVGAENERQSIVDQILEKRKRQKRLLFAIAASGPLASPEAPPEVVAELEKTIKEREKVIEEKNETIHILEMMLASFGISREDVYRYIEQLKSIKSEFEDEESAIASEKIAKAISEQCQRLLAPCVTPFSSMYYSSLIEASITEPVWKKMEHESQTCLITGKIAYQSMLNIGDDSLDYSGVCILASKALDIEMSKRFFHNYIKYLKTTCAVSSWPNTLFDKDGNLLTDDKFTLGSVRYVIGIDEKGIVKNNYVHRLFLQYAKAKLYDSHFPRSDINNHLKKCIESVETVREKYRNPAAHRTPLNQVTAKECFDYLIDTYKKLKEILEVMN